MWRGAAGTRTRPPSLLARLSHVTVMSGETLAQCWCHSVLSSHHYSSMRTLLSLDQATHHQLLLAAYLHMCYPLIGAFVTNQQPGAPVTN